jgi:hypothetical protein
MIRAISGFQHDPELFIVNGVPTYITTGNTYRDKLKNAVQLDTVLLLDVLSECPLAKLVGVECGSAVETETNATRIKYTDRECDDDGVAVTTRKSRGTTYRRVGGRRRYKKANTHIRVAGLDNKQTDYHSDDTSSDNDTTVCIHSAKYLLHQIELDKIYADMEFEWMRCTDYDCDDYGTFA